MCGAAPVAGGFHRRGDLHGNALHFTLVKRIVQAVELGENPLDYCSPERSLGYA